jgi:hypothetical protein
MTDQQDQPQTKRPAMQVALDAEKLARQAMSEVENIGALAAAAAESGGSAPVGGVLAELRKDSAGIKHALTDIVKDIGKVVGLIPGNLWAGQGGALATQQQVAEVRERVENIEGWQKAELEGAQDGGDAVVAGLVEMVAELREEVEQLRFRPPTLALVGDAAAGAPHVLGLIAQLQKRVAEIGKGREFKAENSRGAVTQQYDFRGVEDAQNAIGSAQREIGLIGPAVTVIEKTISTSEVSKGSYTQVWTTVSVTTRYTFQSPVDGSEWSTEGCGMGRDLGDKAESKALAGAFKYALFHGLNIPVKGVFVDAETEDPRIERQQSQDTGRTYGHGHAAPDPHGSDAEAEAAFERALQEPTPGNVQASLAAQHAAPAERPDTRSPEELARDALAAGRKAANADDAGKVWQYAHQRGVLSMHVEGLQLGQHLLAALRLLPGGAALRLAGMEHYL